jgi:hypothetical protein
MSTSPEPDDELIRERYATSLDEDVATKLTRGVVDGFTEASHAFSHELEGTNRFPDLMGRSVAGVIRANARLLDELATMVRQMSDGLSLRTASASESAATDGDLDYERLADLVADRLRAAGAAPAGSKAKS